MYFLFITFFITLFLDHLSSKFLMEVVVSTFFNMLGSTNACCRCIYL